AEIFSSAADHGLRCPSFHVQRASILAPGFESENLRYAHRSIDAAAQSGMTVVSTGLHRPLTVEQRQAMWFWNVQGAVDSIDDETWARAVRGLRSLGTHAAELGLLLSLEMYEDTLLGSADSAVRLVEDIDLP